MKPKLFAKRVLSLILCVVMLVSCWVFTAPQADAGQYDSKYRIRVYLDIHKNDTLNTKSYVNVAWGGENHRIWTASTVNYTSRQIYDNEVSAFPTGMDTNYSFNGWFGNGQWTVRLYVWNYYTNGWSEIASIYQSELGNADHKKSTSVADDKKPKANEIAGINGSDTLTLDPNGSVVKQSYSSGYILDQYGHAILGQSATLTSNNAGGTTFTSNELSAGVSCNRSNDYPVTLTATYGSLTTTKTVTVKTFDYTVNFVNYDGTPIKSQSGIDYGGNADVPTNAQYTITKSADNTYTYTHGDTEWSGDYTNLSGVQTKTVTADYTPHYIDYTVTFNNDDGSLYVSGTYHYGDTVSAPATNPSKQQDDENTYEFAGWSPAVATTCAGSAVYTAQYTPTKRNYTVQFKDADGNVIPGFTQTLNWNAAITAPDTNPTKASTSTTDYTFNKWVNEADGSDYTGRCVGSINYIPSWTESTRHYTVTFQKEDGTVISSNSEMLYESVPSQAGIVPALIEKEPDDNGHYTAAWDRDVTQPITGDTIFKIVYTLEAHEAYLGEATVTKEATCMETGLKEQTCSVCNYVVKTEIPIDPNAHNWQRWEGCDEKNISGLDDTISVIFECENGCGNYCACEYDPQTQEYKPNPGDENENISKEKDALNVSGISPSIKTPTFNEHEEFFDGQAEPYCYRDRKASLRVRSSEKGTDTQAMRFSGNLYATGIFNTVSFDVNPNRIFNNSQLMSLDDIRAKNAADKAAIAAGETVEDVYDDTILDFGFVFTQARFIRTAKTVIDYDLMTLDNIGTDYRIYRMSVVGNNLENYNNQGKSIDNWKGLTVCDDGDLTFNLVIDVNEKNYQATYVARTYVIYKYHGDIICVYDKPIIGADEYTGDEVVRYSHDSVYNQAEKNLALDPQPSAKVIAYLEDKIINNTATQNFNDSKGDKKVDYTLKNPPQ